MQCISPAKTDCVELEYYHHGDLIEYRQKNTITPEMRSKWFQQILEAVVVIHHHGIIHSDLALRQFFVDDNLDLRLGDFNSSQYPDHPALGYEKASHCLPRDYYLPNTEASDIFALGSTLYELVAGKAPYQEVNPFDSQSRDLEILKAHSQWQHQRDIEIEIKYKNHEFPDPSGLFRGDIILGCWRGGFATAEEALSLFVNG